MIEIVFHKVYLNIKGGDNVPSIVNRFYLIHLFAN